MDLERTEHFERLLTDLDDDDLSELSAMVAELQRTRALASEDLEAVVADAFEVGFDHRGMANEPWVTPGGLLVCPGAKIHRSKANHRCRFVAVGDTWVWEAADRVIDELRRLPNDRDSIQTVTVLAAFDGLVIEVVTSKASGGRHERQGAVAYEVRAGRLEPTSLRSTPSSDERR